MRRLDLFLISISAIWPFVIIQTIDIPIYFGSNWKFVGWENLMCLGNWISFIALIALVVTFVIYRRLDYNLPEHKSGLPIKVVNVKKMNESYFSFLTTLIGTLMFDENIIRWSVQFILYYVILYFTLSRSNLFYCNPLFAVLGFSINRIEYQKQKGEVVVLSKGNLSPNDYVSLYHVTDTIYFAKKRRNEEN